MNKITNKKVWFFHPTATSPERNGMTRAHEFAKRLINDNNKPIIFTSSFLHYEGKNVIEDNQLVIEKEESSVPYVFVKTSSYESNGKDRVINMLSYYRNMMKVVKDKKKSNDIPDVIISSSPHPLALVAGIRAGKKLKVPVAVEVRDFWPEVFFYNGVIKEDSVVGKLLLKGEKWIYKNADALIFLKEGDKNYIVEKGWDENSSGPISLDKCYYINNGVDLIEFDNSAIDNPYIDSDLDSEKFNIVYAGSIRKVNNIGFLLDTAKALSHYEDIQFLIFGEGNEVGMLKERIENESISNVKLKGYVSKKHIPNILSKSSLNILNYSQDNYNWSRGNSSNKLFEYMASGKPIISTIKFGYSQLEKYECGLSLNNNSVKEMASKIEKIYHLTEEEQEAMGRKARMGAADYDFDKLYNRLLNVLKELNV